MASTLDGESSGEELDQKGIAGEDYGPTPDVEILYNKELDGDYDFIKPDYFQDYGANLESQEDIMVVFEVGGLEENDLEVVSDALEGGQGVFITKPSYKESFLDNPPEWFNVDDHLKGYWAEVQGEREMYFHIEK